MSSNSPQIDDHGYQAAERQAADQQQPQRFNVNRGTETTGSRSHTGVPGGETAQGPSPTGFEELPHVLDEQNHAKGQRICSIVGTALLALAVLFLWGFVFYMVGTWNFNYSTNEYY